MEKEEIEKVPYSGDISPVQHDEELAESIKILKELKRTLDTNGCYCPFNKAFDWQAKVVHEIREILRERIEY